MMPTESFIALCLLMAVSLAFGYFLRVLMDKTLDELRDTSTHSMDADHDRWEDDPVPTNMCDTCKWDKVPLWDAEAECSVCMNYDMWEAKE